MGLLAKCLYKHNEEISKCSVVHRSIKLTLPASAGLKRLALPWEMLDIVVKVESLNAW